jgi:hypothetical protein
MMVYRAAPRVVTALRRLPFDLCVLCSLAVSALPPDARAQRLEAALEQASDEDGLAEWYRSCVRPLLNLAPDAWPRCCGGNCEPCNEQLMRVARRTLELLGESS